MRLISTGGAWLALLVLGAGWAAAAGELPLVPVRVTLEQPAYVTLVAEENGGARVRNLLSAAYLPRGEHTLWWDGTRDPAPEREADSAGRAAAAPEWVKPGAYRIRGLARAALTPRYEFSFYNSGHPPWPAEDPAGGWLADHSPPQSLTFVPGDGTDTHPPLVYVGSVRNEKGSGLAWVDLEGRKRGGVAWLAGQFTGAARTARDLGRNANRKRHLYAAAVVTRNARSDLRIAAVTTDGGVATIELLPLDDALGEDGGDWELGGLACFNGVLIASFPNRDLLFFIDVSEEAGARAMGTRQIDTPRGLAFDERGRLFLVAGEQVLRYNLARAPQSLPRATPLVAKGLDHPTQIALDAKGNLYVANHGRTNNVMVFMATGRPLRSVGRPGPLLAGRYEPQQMQRPEGMAIDSRGRLWVAENDHLPKRVSVWSGEGQLERAWYGPARFGGGGTLDGRDKRRLLYADEGHGTLEFALDWSRGAAEVAAIACRVDPADPLLQVSGRPVAAPETPFAIGEKIYYTNAFTQNPGGGAALAFIFMERNGQLRPVAGLGVANGWKALDAHAYRQRWPKAARTDELALAFCVWSDRNENGAVDPDEVLLEAGAVGGVTVMPDLSFCVSNLGGRAMRFGPVGATPAGIPLYSRAADILLEGAPPQTSMSGNQAIACASGWNFVLAASDSERPEGRFLFGCRANGGGRWTYPYTGAGGLHGAPGRADADADNAKGVLAATARVLGPPIPLKGEGLGEVWGMGSRRGNIHLFTSDGMFVDTLFRDREAGKPWDEAAAQKGADLSGYTLGADNFWPTLSRAPDGQVYLADGTHTSLVRIDGLDSLRRLEDQTVEVTAEAVAKAREWRRASAGGR